MKVDQEGQPDFEEPDWAAEVLAEEYGRGYLRLLEFSAGEAVGRALGLAGRVAGRLWGRLVGRYADEATAASRHLPAPSSGAGRMRVEPVDQLGLKGRDFVIDDPSGLPRFEARLLEGTKTLQIGWTDDVALSALRLRDVQRLAGGPGSFTRITGGASAGLEAGLRKGTFDVDRLSKAIGRAIGGKWQGKAVQRPGSAPPKFDIIIERLD